MSKQDEFHFSTGDAVVVVGTLLTGVIVAALLGWAESKKESEKPESPTP